MKKTETTHLKASQVGGVDWRRQQRDREVRVWESEFVSFEGVESEFKGVECFVGFFFLNNQIPQTISLVRIWNYLGI